MFEKIMSWVEAVARTAGPLLLALGLILPGTGTAADKGPIKIGWVGGLTGPLAQVIQDAKQGTDFAVEEINAAGGIRGQKLELIYADTKIDPQLARQAVQRMALSDRVAAIIGDYFSPNTLASMDIARDNKIPMISFSALDALTQKKNGFISHVISTNVDLIGSLGAYAVDTLKAKRFVVFTPADSMGSETADVFAAYVKKRGAQMLGYEAYDRATTRDFTNLLAKYKESPPDVIFFGGAQADSALIAKQARQLGINSQLMGNFPVSKPPYYKIGGEVTEGTITVSNYIGLVPNLAEYGEESTKAFVKKWETRFGSPPSDDNANGYDSMKILAQAIEQAKSTSGAAIQQALVRTKNYRGGLGTVNMLPNGDANIPIYILKWRADGKLIVLAKQTSGGKK